MPSRTRRYRGSLVALAIAAVMGMFSYVLTPMPSYGAGGYPGPDALPGVPTYGGYLGTIPVGGESPVSYVCGFDAPNATNKSPHKAIAYIDGVIAAYLPISTQFGCAEFVISVSDTNGKVQAPCGYAYASVNGGAWILIPLGNNVLLVTGIKHYHHVGAYFPFYVPPSSAPNNNSCPPPTSSTTTTTISPTTTPTTIHGQTTTTAIPPTSTTIPGFSTTTSVFNAGSTSTVPPPINKNPGTVLKKITEIVTFIAVIVAAGAAAAAAGELVGGVPEALVEEYTTEIPPGGGLPYNEFPTGGAGALAAEEDEPDVIPWATTDMPPGGGYPVGGEIPSGTIADEYAAWSDQLEDEELLGSEPEGLLPLFDWGDTDIEPGGGAPMTELTDRTGGNEQPGDEQ